MMQIASLRAIALLAVTIVLSVLAGCGSTEEGAGDGADGVTSVELVYATPVAQLALPTLAANEGLFPDDVDVTVSYMSSAQLAGPLTTGQLQLIVAAAPTPEVAALGGGDTVPLKWLGTWNSPPDGDLIGGPGIETVADLRGKKFGVSNLKSFSYYMILIALEAAGLTEDDVDIVPLGSLENLVPAFISGKVDAMIGGAPLTKTVLAERDGSSVLWTAIDNEVPWVGAGLAAYGPWLEENEDAAVSVLKGLNDALEVFHSDPEAAKRAISEVTSLRDEADVNEAYETMLEQFSEQVVPVPQETLEYTFEILREGGFAEAEESLVPSFTTAEYAEQAIQGD